MKTNTWFTRVWFIDISKEKLTLWKKASFSKYKSMVFHNCTINIHKPVPRPWPNMGNSYDGKWCSNVAPHFQYLSNFTLHNFANYEFVSLLSFLYFLTFPYDVLETNEYISSGWWSCLWYWPTFLKPTLGEPSSPVSIFLF